METLRALMRGVLPPAGNPIYSLAYRTDTTLPSFEGYHTTWVDSGTSALALALISARQARPELVAPEVIIPAYCCPDLAAAANYAGIKLVVVDISANDPAYDAAHLHTALNHNTLAVIAVNFLGLREPLVQLRKLLAGHAGVFLIEDNAQWFPEENETASLSGDFVVFSFGRGKPVSLLGGGLLLSALPAANAAVTKIETTAKSTTLLRLKYVAYNFLLRPFIYQFLARNPLFKLGVTRYHALPAITALDDYRRGLLTENIQAYRQTLLHTQQLVSQYESALAACSLRNELTVLDSERCARLLRYPLLLATAEQKQQLLHALTQRGLGATAMYQHALVDIEGMHEWIAATECPQATDFAARFMTLPLHTGVTDKYCALIRECLMTLTD